MSMLPVRFTIRRIMDLVAIVAFALALFRFAPEFCSTIVASLTLAAPGLAILGARFHRERVRAFCVGFALFGGAYFLWFVSPTLARGAAGPGRRIVQSLVTLPVAAAGGSAASLGHCLSSRLMTGRCHQRLEAGSRTRPRTISPPE